MKDTKQLLILKSGSDAIHKMGNIGRKKDDWITYHTITDTHYIGNFEFGYGFIDVEFKKEDVREPTKEEVEHLRTKSNSLFGYSYKFLKYDGHFMTLDEKREICDKVILDNILDDDGFDKLCEFDNEIGNEFYITKDIEIGEALTLYGSHIGIIYLRTSKITNIDTIGDDIQVNTQNSIYLLRKV